jgi:hypothetical protein
MSKVKRKKLKLNIKFNQGIVVCAKSPRLCKECKDLMECERIDIYYDQFQGIKECFKNSESKR